VLLALLIEQFVERLTNDRDDVARSSPNAAANWRAPERNLAFRSKGLGPPSYLRRR